MPALPASGPATAVCDRSPLPEGKRRQLQPECGLAERRGTLDLRGLRPWGALFAVLLLVTAELAARSYLPDVPTQGIYPSYRVRAKVEELAHRSATRSLDVLFVGSSLVDVGVDPVQFDRLCAERGVELTSYNLGINGPPMAGIQPVLDRYFLPRVSPRLVYICVSPNAFNRNAVSSLDLVTERYTRAARVSIAEEVMGRFLQHSRLYADRHDLRLWARSHGAVGFQGKTGRPAGFLPLQGVAVWDDLPSDRLASFTPRQRDVAALYDLCRWCDSVGAAYIIVDMPLPQRSRDLLSAAQRARYRQLLHEAVIPGDTVMSYPADCFAAEHFWDGLHLNSDGAARLTEMLADHAAQRLAGPSSVPSPLARLNR